MADTQSFRVYYVRSLIGQRSLKFNKFIYNYGMVRYNGKPDV